MHLFLVRFVTVRLTYIFIDYPVREYIIILNTLIIINDLLHFSVLLHPFNAHNWKSPSPKACSLTNARMVYAHVYYQFVAKFVAEFHKKKENVQIVSGRQMAES